MSNPPDRPWTEEERYFLLTEILKKAGIPSSLLVRLIHEHHIQPSWGDIPLPPGRSVNSCRIAFDTMQAHFQPYPPAAPAAPATAPIVPATIQMPRPDMTRASAPPIDPNLRKRPLYASDKPRAIQPRPPASVASYSSESGASAQLSPRLDGAPGEPPRKRGRPSKAETERRKAAAEARGETYPPPRRPGSGRLKISSPNSSRALPITSYAHVHGSIAHPLHGSSSNSIPYDPSAGRPLAPAPSLPSGNMDDRRDLPGRAMGPNLRELPRPQEMSHQMNHPLPSPHALQLGPPDSIPRFNSNPGERGSFSAIPQDRFSPDSGRRDSVTSRGDPTPQCPFSEPRASTTPGEKPR